MTSRIFPTAQDAENAFYEALERGDLEAMMAVWAEDEDIICVHPTGPRLSGQDQVRESWAKIFAGGTGPRVHITHQVAVTGMMIAVHSVHENFTLEGEARTQVPVVATNVYLRTAAGWRMIVHHASPGPAQTPRRRSARGAAEVPALKCDLPIQVAVVAARRPPADPRAVSLSTRRAWHYGASAGTRRTATSSTWISAANRGRRSGWCCSTASKAAPTATMRARSPRTRSAAVGALRRPFPRLLGRPEPYCRAPITPAIAKRSTGC